MKIDFQEEQKFTQWWLWVILILTGIFPIFGMYKQFVLGESFGNKPLPPTLITPFFFNNYYH